MVQVPFHPIRQLLQSGKELLFPSVCHLCDREIQSESRTNFCYECLPELYSPNLNRCELCSAVVGPNLSTSEGCFYCKGAKFVFKKVTTLGTYENQLKHAILRGKVGHDVVLLQSLTMLLIESFSERIRYTSTNLIIPIPHHWRDRLLQSSQASSTISNHLQQLLKVPVHSHILKKIERTAKQHTLTPPERRENLKNAFYISPKVNLTGAKIMLVDDVITTGTTCQRAARKLMKAGAEQVNVFALARGIGA